LVPADDVLPTALGLADAIAANAPLSVRRMKATAVKGLELPLWQALRLDVGPNPYLSEDRKEGIAAQREKRAPRWSGR
jgi:enoyl-CoA hydratase